MAGRGQQAFLFRELKPDVLQSLREELGLEEWAAADST